MVIVSLTRSIWLSLSVINLLLVTVLLLSLALRNSSVPEALACPPYGNGGGSYRKQQRVQHVCPKVPPGDVNKDQVSFLKVASKHGTDKVTIHKYHHMYNKYLGPIRNNKLKMLEIGLGCDRAASEIGGSLYTWLEFLPDVDLHYIEFDSKCVDVWNAKNLSVSFTAGDQANAQFLQEYLKKTGGEFDVIVDDGGHTMRQQIVSFENLFRGLKQGGIYFCEDLLTSYHKDFGGGIPPVEKTMISYIKDLIDDLNVLTAPFHDLNRTHDISKDIMSVDCMEEICAFTRFKDVDKRPD